MAHVDVNLSTPEDSVDRYNGNTGRETKDQVSGPSAEKGVTSINNHCFF